MKNKHTPGKWEICNQTETQIFIASTQRGARTEQGKGSYICQIKQEREHYGINEQDEANARLITHAPELLQMVYDLKQCIKRLTQDDLTQFDRDTEAQWEGEAHELLTRINPDWYDNANKYRLSQNTTVQHNTLL